MIQLNLLPDVKLEYIRSQRSRRLVIAIAFFATAVSLVLLIAMLVIGGVQKKYLSDLSKDVNKDSSQLKNEPDIDKILTVQNQLGSITALHDGKPNVPSVFSYLNEVTPTDSVISSFRIDFVAQTISIDGGSGSLSGVNKYVDTLKYTMYTIDNAQPSTKAFNNVVLTSFGLNSDAGSTTRPASFSVTLTYDPLIFDITKNVQLQIPSQTTTRAGLDNADALFQNVPKPTTKAGNQP